MSKINGLLFLGVITALALVVLSADNLRAADEKAAKPAKAVTMKASFSAHTTPPPNPGATSIASPAKLCSGVLAPSWRDTITVPDDWKAGTCQNFAWSIGTNSYQLGCANPDSFSWGTSTAERHQTIAASGDFHTSTKEVTRSTQASDLEP